MSAALTTERVEGTLLVRLAGEIDMANAYLLEAQIATALADANGLVVSLSDVTYFDSSGLRMLDGLVGACEAAGLPMRVVAPDPGPARFILRMCAWRRELLAHTLEEALSNLRV